MQGIVRAANGGIACFARRKEAAIFSHHIARRKIQQGRSIAVSSRLEPALIEIVISNRSADDAEGMEVFLMALMPADELNAQLVCRFGGANEFLFIDAEPLDQSDKRRYRGFADGNR